MVGLLGATRAMLLSAGEDESVRAGSVGSTVCWLRGESEPVSATDLSSPGGAAFESSMERQRAREKRRNETF